MDRIVNIIQAEIKTPKSKADAIIVNNELFTFKNTGLTRRVFVNEDKTQVIKVPITEMDAEHNRKEAEMWQYGSDEFKAEFAKTELLQNGYIVQEYLQTLDDEETEEKLGRTMTMKEIRFASNCRNEVGFDKDGNLKCYDYDEYRRW